MSRVCVLPSKPALDDDADLKRHERANYDDGNPPAQASTPFGVGRLHAHFAVLVTVGLLGGESVPFPPKIKMAKTSAATQTTPTQVATRFCKLP